MANFRNVPSSFFVFCTDDLSTKLKIPTEFGNQCKNFLRHAATIELSTTHSDGSWAVNVKRREEKWYLREGWSHFAKDNRLLTGNLLTFRISGESSLEVSVFRQDSCMEDPSRSFSPTLPSSDADADEDEDRPPTRWRFIKQLKKHHFTNSSRMEIPNRFVWGTGLSTKRFIRLENDRGMRWQIRLTDRGKKVFSLTGGWRQFLTDSDLQAGDFLLFEFVNNSGNVVKVVELEEEAGAKLAAAARKGGLIID